MCKMYIPEYLTPSFRAFDPPVDNYVKIHAFKIVLSGFFCDFFLSILFCEPWG